MFFALILVIIGVIVYFVHFQKMKCDICGNEVIAGDTESIGSKTCCLNCLKKKKCLGLIKYRNEIFSKSVKDILIVDEYEKYITDLYNDEQLSAGKGSKTNKYVMANGVLISPTLVISTIYDNLAFRTKEIVAITMEEDILQKELKSGYLGYLVTLFTKNKFIPFLHTYIIGTEKLFKFNSTQEKERRNTLAEGLNAVFSASNFRIDIPYSNYNGLKEYVNENEVELNKKGIFTDLFTKDIFIENIENASLVNLKDLIDKKDDNATESGINACKVFTSFGYNDNIPLIVL